MKIPPKLFLILAILFCTFIAIQYNSYFYQQLLKEQNANLTKLLEQITKQNIQLNQNSKDTDQKISLALEEKNKIINSKDQVINDLNFTVYLQKKQLIDSTRGSNGNNMTGISPYESAGNFWKAFPQYKTRKFAYAFYASDNNYLCGVLVNIKRIRSFGTLPNVDFILFYRNIDAQKIEFVKKQNILAVPGSDFRKYVASGYYLEVLMKLQIFQLYDYERVIFFDSDSLLLRSIDHLFFLPDVPVAIPIGYWFRDCTYLTSMLLVVKPSKENWERVEKHFPAIKEKQWYDMDILNNEFSMEGSKCRLYPEIIILPSEYGLLIGEWTGDLMRKTKHHGTPENIFEKGYLVHFSGTKPWHKPAPKQDAHPYYYKVYDIFKEIANEAC